MWWHLRNKTATSLHTSPSTAPNTSPHIFFLSPHPHSLSGWRRKAVPDVEIFSVQPCIKTWLFGGGGRVALHRLGSLFIEMEEEGRKNKYTTTFKHLLCLLDVMWENTVCPAKNWLHWDEADTTGLKTERWGCWCLCCLCHLVFISYFSVVWKQISMGLVYSYDA